MRTRNGVCSRIHFGSDLRHSLALIESLADRISEGRPFVSQRFPVET
ncbi:hypothetical protein SAMN04488515_1435 [Cognatiyoonia koreensis]|uniref:Uncharacterized protein n=1 Tax=Cognatiyoonia koreensis TaxID=364200 RepID=A0A1I0PUE0_9RHOB|nr:hypothetical protein SAMN04488515_1435 [Cognatiyoonia koreensis]